MEKIPTLKEVKQYFITAQTVTWAGSDIKLDFDSIKFEKISGNYKNCYTTIDSDMSVRLIYDGEEYANISSLCLPEELSRRQNLLTPIYEIY